MNAIDKEVFSKATIPGLLLFVRETNNCNVYMQLHVYEKLVEGSLQLNFFPNRFILDISQGKVKKKSSLTNVFMKISVC
jgi:hypothetical protein